MKHILQLRVRLDRVEGREGKRRGEREKMEEVE